MSRAFIGRSHPYLGTDEIADLLNEAAGKNVWDARRVRRWLRRRDAIQRVGGRWVTTRNGLRDAFPEMWTELLMRLPADDDDAA